MDFFAHLARALADVIHPHLQQVALAIVASLLFIYGEDLNGLIKKQIQRYHFLIRLAIFMLVCAFGYGMLTIFLTMLVARFLASLDAVYLIPALLGFFFIGGILAERKKQL
jgi:hypothetical protein